MIYFPKLGNTGRLGNQLFQYAALRGLCLKNGYKTKLPNLSRQSWHGQKSLLGEFNISGDVYNDEPISNKYSEPSWKSPDKNFYNVRDNSIIEGFFQSIFYFEDYQDIIKKELTPKIEYVERNKEYIKGLKNDYPDHEIVSVHLRRGDNLQNLNTRNNEIYQSVYKKNGLYFDYFNKAKEVFKDKKVKYLIFTGGSRGNEDNSADMAWCKTNFSSDEFIYSEDQKQIDDFARIMLCDHNIISHISSFGWWAAYVNPNPNKIVVAPKFYHPDEPTLIRDKFYPEEYILI
jgi:hypothetical protein